MIRGGLLLVAFAGLSGCVTFYQPLTGLARPVAIDSTAPNFDGLRVDVRCLESDYLDSGDASQLCEKVGALFTNQGAKVDVINPGEPTPNNPQGGKADLTIDLKGRLVREENSGLWWTLCIASGTLLPSVAEFDFAQDVVVRDATGFEVLSETMTARFIRYFGLGVWAGNAIVYGVTRLWEKASKAQSDPVNAYTYREDFSRDFYNQLTQLAFNAKMRAKVLREFSQQAPTVTPPAATGVTPPTGAAPPAQPLPKPTPIQSIPRWDEPEAPKKQPPPRAPAQGQPPPPPALPGFPQ